MAKAQEPEKVSAWGRVKQIGTVFSFTAKRDKLFVPLVAAAVMLALLGTMILLNLRSQKAMMAEAEGQPGASASIVETMRGDWRVSPAIASTTQFDMVHLVIGRPGVILL